VQGGGRTAEGQAVAAAFVLVAVLTVAYGHGDFLPELASRHGAGIDAMLDFLLLCTGAMFLAGHLALGYFVWKGAGRRVCATGSYS
jgi:hypothetical protein